MTPSQAIPAPAATLTRRAAPSAAPSPPVGTSSTYRNPVLPGFFPDPSVCRVGNDYYCIHSTFQYFPAIVISHSTDLVHWRQIGHVFDRSEQLDLRPYFDGCGVWAPDLSYHDGWFYVFYCLVQLTRDRTVNVRGNYRVRSRSIHGPWSSPVQLTAEGNDPSHFVDDDGTRYLLYAAGLPLGDRTKIARLNDDSSCLAEEPRWMIWGPQRRAPEGPHLFKRHGWYYHTMAAGSGYVDAHHQIIARSRSVYGPYQPSPHNPFLHQPDKSSPLQHHGHAKLVQTPTGEWYAMYLMQRRLNGVSVLGRETGLDRVDWLDDDWPVINAGTGPSAVAPIPAHVPTKAADPIGGSFTDPFDPADPDHPLHVRWYTVRNPESGAVDVLARPGHLRLTSGAGPAPRTLLLCRETSHRYTAETKVQLAPDTAGEAGLACYYDSASHITLSVIEGDSPRLALDVCRRGERTRIAEVARQTSARSRATAGGESATARAVWLRVRVDGLSRSFEFGTDGVHWAPLATIADASFLSDEGTPNWGFTGTMVGLFAGDTEGRVRSQADFDLFRLRNEATGSVSMSEE